MTDKFAALLDQFTQSGSPDLTPPTIDQLFTNGNLKQPHRNGPFWGGQYVINMTMVPAGCTQEAGQLSCLLRALSVPSRSRKAACPMWQGAARVALAGGSSSASPRCRGASVISGLNGAWAATNPLGNQAAVILATNGPGSDGDSVWIARDGHLTWTGSQNVNGVDLHNVGQHRRAQGTIAAPTLAASNVAVSNAVRSPSTLFVQNTDGSTPAPADMGQATLHGALQLANIGVPRATCTPPTVVGNSDGSGQVLTCHGRAVDPCWRTVAARSAVCRCERFGGAGASLFGGRCAESPRRCAELRSRHNSDGEFRGFGRKRTVGYQHHGRRRYAYRRTRHRVDVLRILTGKHTMYLRVLLLKLLLLVSLCLTGNAAFAVPPFGCTPGNQDNTCLTAIRGNPIPPPLCSTAPGWTTVVAAGWIGSQWTQPQCNFQPAPTCPSGNIQTQSPVWNGVQWIGLSCAAPAPPPPTLVSLGAPPIPFQGGFVQLVKGHWFVTPTMDKYTARFFR